MNNSLEYNLSLVLAHSVIYEAKQQVPCADDFKCEGDQDVPSLGKISAQIAANYGKTLPEILNAVIAAQPAAEAANLAAMQQTSGPIAQLQTDLYRQYGPQLSQIGSDINRQEALNTARTEAEVLQGPGKELLGAYDSLTPGLATARDLTTSKLTELLGGIDPNRLSGSERAEVERSLARDNAARGLSDVGSNLNTVENAMTFGSALEGKRQSLINALNVANQTIPTVGAQFQGMNLTGRPTAPNLGATKFTGVQQPSNTASSFGDSLLSSMTGLQNTKVELNANRRGPLETTLGVLPDY